MNLQDTLVVLLAILIICLPVDYVVNIVKFFCCDFDAPYKAEVIRGICIFPLAPLGCVVGWIPISDGPKYERIPVHECHKSQFYDGKIPERGDKIVACTTLTAETYEIGERVDYTNKKPRKFDSGPIEF
jgi:hypothetical protein